jgi:hypothetical protein
MEHSIKPLLEETYNRRLTEPIQILHLVQFPTMADTDILPGTEKMEFGTPSSGRELKLLEERFMMHFTRYIHGAGHPDAPVYTELIQEKDRNAAKADRAFRARQFLTQMGGVAFLPVDATPLQVSPK